CGSFIAPQRVEITPQFPAAVTTSTLRAIAYRIASSSVDWAELEPSEMLMIRAPWSVAQMMLEATSERRPEPWQSRALIGRILTPNATPATPTPLLPFAPMRPATCVPCPLSSIVEPAGQVGSGEVTNVVP